MILIILSHPYIHHSHANQAILKNITKNKQVKVNNLYEKYPDFHINVMQEQALLREAKLIVFQFPIYWYNVPALFKQWQEVVLTKKFISDENAQHHALRGKPVLAVVTTGHKRQSYRQDAFDNYTLEDFLRPLEQLSMHCGMDFQAPLSLHQAHRASNDELSRFSDLYLQQIEQIVQQVSQHNE
jgi:glutathione-regulated potassium-efflux system ancillary protein KefG